MKLKHYLLLLVTIPLLSFSTHKYYLSLTDMEYNAGSKSLQVIINVFMDDIELALNTDYKLDMKLSTKQEIENSNTYFEKYLKGHLEFKINGTPKDFNFLGKEYEGDLVFFYLEIPNVEALDQVEIKNRILLQYFEDQQNIVKLKKDKLRRSKILNIENDKALLKF